MGQLVVMPFDVLLRPPALAYVNYAGLYALAEPCLHLELAAVVENTDHVAIVDASGLSIQGIYRQGGLRI